VRSWRAPTEVRICSDPTDALRGALVAMNSAIFRAALNSAAYEGMATTVVIAWFLGGRLLGGACRGLASLSPAQRGSGADHARPLVFAGTGRCGMVSAEEARVLPAKTWSPRRWVPRRSWSRKCNDYDVQPDDIVLMCSDGLTEMVSHLEIGGLITGLRIRRLWSRARRLIDLAKRGGRP